MIRQKTPLDTYDIIPDEQRAYLKTYGKHFNEKMYRFAVSLMRNSKGEKITPIAHDSLTEKLQANNIALDNDILYDAAFVYSMALSDFFGSSIEDEQHLLLYVKDLIDDTDQADGFVFNRWYADTVNNGIPIDWAAMI